MSLCKLPVAVGAALAAVLLAGCGKSTSVVDAGARASTPPLPVTLWNVTPPPPASPPPSMIPYEPTPLPDLTLPPGGDLRSVDARKVIAKDPNLEGTPRQSVQDCKPGSGCGLRRPELRDITGDGRPELLVLIDPDPRLQPVGEAGPRLPAELRVYWSDKSRVYQILGLAMQETTQVDLQGPDLVIRTTHEPDRPGSIRQVTTDRYRWNPELRQLELHSTVTTPTSGTQPPENPSPASQKPSALSPKAASDTP
ncbi:hypothetical protein [Streptomyces roseochromogenus]|uniref:Lipoprotein n=1 Tax=Streptomyces roseochromogenus subsp. oscitans DS 12.976 TaxID=1352936 RepID=V6K8G6_STRRC|nr:hypothetical protein [Streptomyces roseochromogenus]EST25249.1 hypothetical protein M878_29245 [Streptomyces roseochromogenus subsp. oscitans DS 12.976]